MINERYDAIVVGGGIAGLTAAAYIARAGKTVMLFEQQQKVGGLVQTFERDGIYFDGGLRSIENSGIVFPMLKQLGIDIEFVKSNISIGIANSVLRLNGNESVDEYEKFLSQQYPESKKDVQAIVGEIKKIMGYMDILYGIDNPAFLNMAEDRKYLMKVILPWMFKFIFTLRKIKKINMPVDDYLTKFTNNQLLIDIIAQHFFQKTPASFALSYFSLYLDYHYPKGGTATLIKKLEKFIVENGGIIKTGVKVQSLQPEEKFVSDSEGCQTFYSDLVWAGDMKQMYNLIPVEELIDKKIAFSISKKRTLLKGLNAGDSVFTVFLSVNEHKDFFNKICTGHFFYTPDNRGLNSVDKSGLDLFMNAEISENENDVLKNKLKQYLEEYFRMNTFEIAIPVLRDSDLAPEGKVGVIVSLLYDYRLAKKIEDFGWTLEIKLFLEQICIQILDQTIFPGLKNKVFSYFSSSPLTIEKMTGNSEGGITGWAFTNPVMPAVSSMLGISKAVLTSMPHIYQAGQWTYSPAGLPISILTGKMAADNVLKNSR